ncbi:unnamed protein product [Arabis nemorensis]|uniref:Uncharacterized protein n=1 Tax=Arabis nemorensis TaxID=586526 RepID=A0A565BM12_9BRAS|nr:unnamed protein product [Arabis nemorensis]
MTEKPDCNGVDRVMSEGSNMEIEHEMVNHVAFITTTVDCKIQEELDSDEIGEPKSSEDYQGLFNLWTQLSNAKIKLAQEKRNSHLSQGETGIVCSSTHAS